MIVVDANILAYLVLPGPLTATASRLATIQTVWAAPLLARSELRNALALQIRLRTISLYQALAAMERAERALSGRLLAVPSLDVLSLAAQSGCTAYDCEYVALAQQLGTKLITEDKQLLKRFPKITVPLSRFH